MRVVFEYFALDAIITVLVLQISRRTHAKLVRSGSRTREPPKDSRATETPRDFQLRDLRRFKGPFELPLDDLGIGVPQLRCGYLVRLRVRMEIVFRNFSRTALVRAVPTDRPTEVRGRRRCCLEPGGLARSLQSGIDGWSSSVHFGSFRFR